MDLFKIQHDLIASRTADAWYRIRATGPDFHYRWTYGFSADGDFSNIMGEHYSHAVCREEPSLTMSWGMDVHDRHEKLQFDWAKNFPNQSVRAFWVDFYWNNALIDRVELLSVDGAHGIIPVPDYDGSVTDYDLAVAFLLHDLNGSPSHDNPGRYVEMLGFKAVRDQERQGAGSS